MQTQAEQVSNSAEAAFEANLLQGYRFSACGTTQAIATALEVRRQVYRDGSGYDVPVPDSYDARSWFLSAQDLSTGQVVGSMRLTPRSAGPLEAEECFRLPLPLQSPRAVEISRFAILPEYRKGKTFLPIVSLGLFSLVKRFLGHVGAQYMVVCSKPQRVWTFEWLCFRRSGLSARYPQLGNTEHELLWADLRQDSALLEGHPFREFLLGHNELPEVVVSEPVPRLGFQPAPEPLRAAIGA